MSASQLRLEPELCTGACTFADQLIALADILLLLLSMSTRKRAASEEAEDTRLTQRVRGSATRARGSIENASSLLHITTTAPPCPTTDALLALLDFTSLTTHDEISARFDNIAEAILHSFGLRIANPDGAGTVVYTDYEVIELEFYLHIPGLHEDPFTHGSDEQRQSGKWYISSCKQNDID